MVAYFSMEIAVDPEVPTYAGGLGVLAGDFVRAGADVGLPLVAVTLLQRKGYFRQLYDTLERTVLPLFYRDRDRFTEMMRYAIALNGSFFTAQRMLQEYVVKAYGPDAVRESAPTTEAPPHGVATVT